MRLLTGRALMVPAVLSGVLTLSFTAGAANQARGPELDRNATLRVGELASNSTLDPHLNINRWNDYTAPFYDRLTTLDAQGLNVLPSLARSWAFSKDGRALTLNLRNDVKFHDGTPLTSAAVKASLQRAKTLPGSTAAPFLENVISVATPSRYVVRLNIRPGTGADLPALLSTDIGTVINPKFFNSALATDPPPGAGSGPYVFSKISLPNSVVLERWKGKNWRPDVGLVKTITLDYEFNGTNGIQGVRSGDYDIAQVTPEAMQEARSTVRSADGTLKGRPFVVRTQAMLLLNATKPPFNNALLREAVASAINPNAIGNGLFAGNCPPTFQPVPTGPYWAYDQSLKNAWPYNPSRARALLAQAGMPDGFSFDLTHGATSLFPPLAQAIQQQLAAVGIKARLKPVLSTALVPQITGKQFEGTAWNVQSQPDPSLIVTGQYLAGRGLLVGTPFEKQVDTLAQRALNPNLSLKQRAALYGQIWGIINRSAVEVGICATGQMWIQSKRVVNGLHAPLTWAGFLDPSAIGIAK